MPCIVRSRSGYYRWLNRPHSQRHKYREQVEQQVLDIYATYKARYGAPRIARELRALGVSCSTNLTAKNPEITGFKSTQR